MNKTKFQQQLEDLLKQYEKEDLSKRIKKGLAKKKKRERRQRSFHRQ